MTFTFYQGGVVVSNQITRAQLSNKHLFAHTLRSRTIFTVYHNRIMYPTLAPLQVISYESARAINHEKTHEQ